MTGPSNVLQVDTAVIVIGIRELRQHAGRYLRRVHAGETITLTDRGEPFAEIRL